MATPVRVAVNMKRRPTATSTAMTMAMISCHARFTPATVTVLSAPKNSGNSRGVRGVGSQIHVLRARNPSITLTGTTMRATSETLRNPRITTPYSAAPSSGASTPSTTSRAIGAGQPHPHRICQ